MDTPTPEQLLIRAVGARIATLRKARNITQEQLAERVNAAPQSIRRIERGKASAPLGRLLDIAATLGVSIQDLFAGVEVAVPPPTWDTEQAAVVELWMATPADLRPLLLDIMGRFAARR